MHTMAWSPTLSSWLGGWMFPFTSQIHWVIVQFIPLTFGSSIWHDSSLAVRLRICSALHSIMCTPFQEKPSTNNYAYNTMKSSKKNALKYDQRKEIVVSYNGDMRLIWQHVLIGIRHPPSSLQISHDVWMFDSIGSSHLFEDHNGEAYV